MPRRFKAVALAAAIIMGLVMASGCTDKNPPPVVPPLEKMDTQGMARVGESFDFAGFSVVVTAAVADELAGMVLNDPLKSVLKVSIDYPPDKAMSSGDVALTDIYGVECAQYLGDGLDYLSPAYRGTEAYVRFVTDKDQTEFVMTAKRGTDEHKIYIIKGEIFEPEDGGTEEDNMRLSVFDNIKASRQMHVINRAYLSDDTYIMISSLQGITAQTSSRIIITGGGEASYDHYVSYLQTKRGHTVNIYTDPWELVARFGSEIKDNGYIKLVRSGNNINMASVIAGVEGWLVVPQSLTAVAEQRGLVKRYDFGDKNMTDLDRKREVFESYKDRLNKGALVHQSPDKLQMRDLAVALKLFCFYTDENSHADRQFRNTVLAWADANIPVMGWTDDEIRFVADCSAYGKMVIPMDWSSNHSYFAATKADGKLKQKAVPDNAITATKGKHYLAIVVSDGDNIQWVSRNFAIDSTLGQRLNGRTDYKVTWTFPPMLVDIGGIAAEYVYSRATENDSFIAGVSGAGYINSSTYPDEHLDSFTKLTSQLMSETDMEVVTLLDNRNNIPNDAFAEAKLSYYARYDNIIGGIWEMDPDRYESGKGKIFWSNGKPFMSVRLSLWHPSNNPEGVNEAWLDTYAQAINSYSTDPSTEGGYTILNVHPWTINMRNVEYLVSKLASHVEIVSAPEIIRLLTQSQLGDVT